MYIVCVYCVCMYVCVCVCVFVYVCVCTVYVCVYVYVNCDILLLGIRPGFSSKPQYLLQINNASLKGQ